MQGFHFFVSVFLLTKAWGWKTTDSSWTWFIRANGRGSKHPLGTKVWFAGNVFCAEGQKLMFTVPFGFFLISLEPEKLNLDSSLLSLGFYNFFMEKGFQNWLSGVPFIIQNYFLSYFFTAIYLDPSLQYTNLRYILSTLFHKQKVISLRCIKLCYSHSHSHITNTAIVGVIRG